MRIWQGTDADAGDGAVLGDYQRKGGEGKGVGRARARCADVGTCMFCYCALLSVIIAFDIEHFFFGILSQSSELMTRCGHRDQVAAIRSDGDGVQSPLEKRRNKGPGQARRSSRPTSRGPSGENSEGTLALTPLWPALMFDLEHIQSMHDPMVSSPFD